MANPAKDAQDKHLKALDELHKAAAGNGFHDLAAAADSAHKSALRAMDAHASGDTPKQRLATADLLMAHAQALIADANKGQMPDDLEKAGRKAMKTLGKAIVESAGSDVAV